MCYTYFQSTIQKDNSIVIDDNVWASFAYRNFSILNLYESDK